ncbi:ABC transporter permease [Rhodoligotrophos appendicifer]|uniref:ABC transporter permease n=1 Tax=Rhodoligotrophos appendicifer TaxID=987056 RepID=UPI001FE55151|nr:ABC transporter permease [Rhodoligotrophos appendicifer]
MALLAPAVLVLLVFFVVPVCMLLIRSVTEPAQGLGNYAELLQSSSYRIIFANTFIVSALVTVVSLLLGFPLAWLLAILPRTWSLLLFGIVILSMWTNLLARTFAWLVLLQTTGVINRTLVGIGLIERPLPLVNNLVGVTIGMTYIMLPFIVMPLHATMTSLDPLVFRAASLCGATRWQVFRRIFLPACMPGIMAGALMVFVMSLGYYITPALLGGTANMMVGELIAQLIQSLLNWGLGGAAAFLLLIVTLALYALQLRLFDPLKQITGAR